MPDAGPSRSAVRTDRVLDLLLIAFGLYWLVLGAWMVIHPASFFDKVGPFGARNDHYIRDNATWALALGALVLATVRRVSWRIPVLLLALLQDGLHTINHIADVNKAHPHRVGVFDAVSLALLAVLIVWLVLRSRRIEEPA